jgi:hypothetical protein
MRWLFAAIYLTRQRQQPVAARPAEPDGPGPQPGWRRR